MSAPCCRACARSCCRPACARHACSCTAARTHVLTSQRLMLPFANAGRLPPHLLADTVAQTQHRLWRTATTFDGGLAFTASRTLRLNGTASEHAQASPSKLRPQTSGSDAGGSVRTPLALTATGPVGGIPLERPMSAAA